MLAALILAGCISAGYGSDVPELIEPASISDGTARVDRGDVASVEVLSGIARMRSIELSFGLPSLPFGEYFVMAGDHVTQGQLLAKLDTRPIELQIEAQLEASLRAAQAYEHEIRLAEIEIAILQAELDGLNTSSNEELESGDETAGMAAMKSHEIERARLLLRQARERQALISQDAQRRLEALRQKVSEAELRAPLSGIITALAQISRGDFVEPYQRLVFIGDENDVFIELTSERFIRESAVYPLVVGVTDSGEYQLEVIAPDARELPYFMAGGVTPPACFAVTGPGAALAAGTYISVYLYTQLAEDVLRVPINSVYTEPDAGQYVYIIDDGMKIIRPFEQGLRGDVFVEVLSGLEEGDVVFVKQ